MEQAIVGVHPIIAFCVFFPDALCFCGMEPGRMLLKEALHIGYLQNAVIEVFKRLVPCTGSPFFDCGNNRIHINDMVADLCHQLGQNHLVDAREALCRCQIVHRQLFKSLMKAGFLLNISSHIIKLLNILTMKPFRDKIIAICLMRHGNEFIQSCKIFLPHGTGSGGQQQMNCQLSEIRFFLSKSASLTHHCPKRTICMVFYEVLINHIVVQIQSGTEHAAKNLIRLCFFQAADCRHHSHVQLCRSSRNFILAAYFLAAVFRIEVSTVILDLLPHGRIRCKTHLIHPDRNQVCPELLAVKLHIQKPVIIRLVIYQWIVNQIVCRQIVH